MRSEQDKGTRYLCLACSWNQGIGTFASEVGPSTFFRAYRTIKEQEAKGKSRAEIVDLLMERFGEQNPDVGVQ